jgi:hypothetical protein
MAANRKLIDAVTERTRRAFAVGTRASKRPRLVLERITR